MAHALNNPWLIPLVIGWIQIIAVWVVILYSQRHVSRLTLRPYSQRHPADTIDWPSVSVIVPASNEALTLMDCMRCVLGQDYPRLSAVIVDDRSEDDTRQIAQSIVATDQRVRLVQVDHLPQAWLGKSHALHLGTRNVPDEWLLFIDADCRLHPQALKTVIAHAERCQLAMLTLWPRQAAGGFWEHMLIPLCGGIIALWFRIRGHTGQCRPAFANGQFLLIRRDAYENIGGHAAVKSAIIEDVALADIADRCGLRSFVGSGVEIASVRMYCNLRGIWDGWTRIFLGALRSRAKLLLSVLWLLAGSLLPYLVLGFYALAALLERLPVGSVHMGAIVLATIHLSLLMIVSCRFWGMGYCPRRYLWLYPVSVVLVAAILLRAWWWLTVIRRVTWRHTTYRINRHGVIMVQAER